MTKGIKLAYSMASEAPDLSEFDLYPMVSRADSCQLSSPCDSPSSHPSSMRRMLTAAEHGRAINRQAHDYRQARTGRLEGVWSAAGSRPGGEDKFTWPLCGTHASLRRTEGPRW